RVCFFFQAEDGIRDWSVTGVQTCALPICAGTSNLTVRAQVFDAGGAKGGSEVLVNATTSGNQNTEQITALSNGGFVVTWTDASRSEERRVGKEWRSRRGRGD